MLRIGYIRPRDEGFEEETAALRALGCQVVRSEAACAQPGQDSAVLQAILDFIAPGDQLVVRGLDHLGPGSRGVLDVLDRLEARGATLRVAEPAICSTGDGGRALRAALQAVATIDPSPAGRRRRTTGAREIIELQRAGVGPVEIARRLGVSRMTVWRKLKAVGA